MRVGRPSGPRGQPGDPRGETKHVIASAASPPECRSRSGIPPKPEQPPGTSPRPDQRIEWRDKCLCVDPGEGGGHRDAAMHVASRERRPGPARLPRPAPVSRLRPVPATDGNSRGGRRWSRCHAGCSAFDQGAMRVCVGGSGGLRQHIGGIDLFRQIIDAPCAAPAGRGGDVSCPEQPFQSALGVAPLPPAALSLVLGKVRTLPVDHRHGCGRAPLWLRRAVQLRRRASGSAGISSISPCHAPAQQRVRIERQERGFRAQYSNKRRSRFVPMRPDPGR